MIVIYVLLFIGACVCFGAAAFTRADRTLGRVDLLALGLLLATLVPTIQALTRLAD